MKKILLIILLAAAVIPFQNCKPCDDCDDIVPTDTTKKDTTKPLNEPINSFNVNGVNLLKLKWDSTNMFANYRASTGLTTVICEGYSGSTYATFKLVFPGSSGTVKYSDDPLVNIEVTTGEVGSTKYKKYIFDPQPGRDMIVTIEKYGAVGQHIKGTFTGFLQETASVTAGNIKDGKFEVLRDEDQ